MRTKVGFVCVYVLSLVNVKAKDSGGGVIEFCNTL